MKMFFNIIWLLLLLFILIPKLFLGPQKNNEHKKVYKIYVDLLVLVCFGGRKGVQEYERKREKICQICVCYFFFVKYMYWIKGWIWEFNVFIGWIGRLMTFSHFTHWHFAVAGCWFWIQSNKIYTICVAETYNIYEKNQHTKREHIIVEWMIVNNFLSLSLTPKYKITLEN